jgi:hypothetical protein
MSYKVFFEDQSSISGKEYYEPKNILLMTSQRIEIPNVKIKFAEGRYKWSKIVLEKKKIHLLVEGIKN